MTFHKKLDQAVDTNNSLLCVGLDPEIAKLPASLREREFPQFDFNQAIIDATADLVCAFKPNPAFYEARGIAGITELKKTCAYIKTKYPHIPIIVDAKRGDIGNTNKGYAMFVFEYLEADAMTVMPYMGIESLAIFFDYQDKGIIVGCHSSNPGAKEFQELLIDERPLYHYVAEELMRQQGNNKNCLIFMGATFPQELVDIRKIVKDMTLLVPGVGAQGGDVKTFVEAGKNSQGSGLIINASRSILFASSEKDFSERAREKALELKEEINQYR